MWAVLGSVILAACAPVTPEKTGVVYEPLRPLPPGSTRITDPAQDHRCQPLAGSGPIPSYTCEVPGLTFRLVPAAVTVTPLQAAPHRALP
mgnify:FL=1